MLREPSTSPQQSLSTAQALPSTFSNGQPAACVEPTNAKIAAGIQGRADMQKEGKGAGTVMYEEGRKTWEKAEDEVILRMVTLENNRRWSEIALKLPGRTGKQCRERFKNQLDPRIKKAPWTAEEDEAVIAAQKKVGNKWTEIARMLVGRTDNSVKNRWNSAIRKRLIAEGRLTADDRQIEPTRVRQAPAVQQTSQSSTRPSSAPERLYLQKDHVGDGQIGMTTRVDGGIGLRLDIDLANMNASHHSNMAPTSATNTSQGPTAQLEKHKSLLFNLFRRTPQEFSLVDGENGQGQAYLGFGETPRTRSGNVVTPGAYISALAELADAAEAVQPITPSAGRSASLQQSSPQNAANLPKMMAPHSAHSHFADFPPTPHTPHFLHVPPTSSPFQLLSGPMSAHGDSQMMNNLFTPTASMLQSFSSNGMDFSIPFSPSSNFNLISPRSYFGSHNGEPPILHSPLNSATHPATGSMLPPMMVSPKNFGPFNGNTMGGKPMLAGPPLIFSPSSATSFGAGFQAGMPPPLISTAHLNAASFQMRLPPQGTKTPGFPPVPPRQRNRPLSGTKRSGSGSSLDEDSIDIASAAIQRTQDALDSATAREEINSVETVSAASFFNSEPPAPVKASITEQPPSQISQPTTAVTDTQSDGRPAKRKRPPPLQPDSQIGFFGSEISTH